MSDSPRYPLPDIPRAPGSDLTRLLRAIIEHGDFEALTRLPDFLQDAGRVTDAETVRRMVVTWVKSVHSFHFTSTRNGNEWRTNPMRDGLIDLFFLDLFDWERMIASAACLNAIRYPSDVI